MEDVVHPTLGELELASAIAECTDLTKKQVPGLALALAGYRDKLLVSFEALAESITGEAEQSEPAAAAAFIRCADTIRASIKTQRS